MKRLTIGMPVYNNAATIRTALDSLLAQTHDDFEMVISDNGSTDETGAICQDYAARDRRLRYVRQPSNLGPAMNFRFVLFEARTPYFMWAAGDDRWTPTFAERNVEMLERDASLAMSQSQVLFTIDGQPAHMSTGTYPLMGSVEENVARYLHNPADNSRYYGVWRTDILRKIFPDRSFFALDWAVAAATLRYGKHYEIPEVLMFRDSSESTAYANMVAKEHRSLAVRIFPLLYMTRWLLRRGAVPVTSPILYHLLKSNLYMHFRFGLYRIDALGERFLASHSIRHALGLPAVGVAGRAKGLFAPGMRGRLVRGAEQVARVAWRKLPISMAMRETIKARTFRMLGERSRHLSAYEGWRRHAARVMAFPPPDLPPAGAPMRALRRPAGDPLLALVVIEERGPGEPLHAIRAAAALCEATDAEVILVVRAGAGAASLATPEGVRRVEAAPEATVGAMMNVGVGACRAARILMMRGECWYGPELGAATLEALDASALAAPQLVHADGRLAAAGGVLSREEGFQRYGERAVPSALAYSYARACDFAPGAFAWRREVDLSDQPFDATLTHFDLAVADRCLKLRSQFGPPLYWPFARVVHPSPGPEAAARPASPSWDKEASRLMERHDAILAQDEALLPERRPPYDKWRGRRALYIDADTPAPDRNSGSMDALNLIKILDSMGFRVTFVPESNFAHRDRYTDDLQKIGVRALFSPLCSSVEQALAEAPEPFDLVVLCRGWIAERYVDVVRRLAPKAKIAFNTVDLHFLREQREAELNNDAAALAAAEGTKRTELSMIAACDATIVLSTFERDMLAREGRTGNVHVLPLLRAVPERLEAPGPENRRDVMFVGTYQHPPNEDAAVYFAREIWPLVRPRLPGANFLIVGSSMTPTVAALASDDVKVLGFVPDLDPLLHSARVSVAPLRFGAGLKGKVGTALQAGLPTVASDVAAEGMGLVDGREVLIASDPAAIADAVVRLYQDDDLWRLLAAEGFAFVRREFSIEANAPRVAALLADVGLATPQSERLLMHRDLETGDPLFRPSRFWTELSKEHESALAEWRMLTFKRTVNNCYMQWLPSSFDDPRMKIPMETFRARPSTAPVEIAASMPAEHVLTQDVHGYGGFRPFANPDYARFYGFYVGLLWHHMSQHASDDLYRRIEEPGLGHPIALSWKGQAISQDLASSLIEHYRIKQLCSGAGLPQRPTYLELGAGYGRVAYVVLSAAPCRYVIVDIPPTLLVAKWYLSRVFPDRKVFGYRPFERYEDVKAEIEAADIVFLTPNQYATLPDLSVDVSLSISSLHEMTTAQVAAYKALLQRTTRSVLYIKQWESWRNPSDGTEFRRADYQMDPPWTLVLDSVDIANVEFFEQGWLRGEDGPAPPAAPTPERRGLKAK
jgi:putative sugar O-methyltransferase